MQFLAALFGGLGLFFLGIRGLSGQLAALAGNRFRAEMARSTGSPWQAAGLGLLLGGVTQSSNAVTFITASMRSAELIAPRRALPLLAWANVGTAALVLLATFDLRAAALWLLGVTGFAIYFFQEGGGRWRPVLAALSSLGLMLLGLGLIKAGSAEMQDLPMVRDILTFAGAAWLPAFVIGVLVTMVAQSSSTVSILAITFQAGGLLTFDQAVATIYGASLGSGVSVWLLASGLEGTARQPVIFQAMLRAFGAFLFLLLLVLEQMLNVPLVIAAVGQVAARPATQLALVFLALQLGVALLVAPLHRPLEGWLARLAPPSAREMEARPRYLYPQALDDAPSALLLVSAEQKRLANRLPLQLDPVREESEGSVAHDEASAALEGDIARFLSNLLARELSADSLRDALRLQARLGLLLALRETLGEYVAVAVALPDATVIRPLSAMTEALHLLLEELREMEDAAAASWLVDLAADRGEMMQRLRRRAAGAADENLFLLSGLFERAVWLVRRLALLELDSV